MHFKKNLITIRKTTERPETEILNCNFVSLNFSKIQKNFLLKKKYYKMEISIWKKCCGKNCKNIN